MKIENILGDNIGYVKLLAHMGGDQAITDRARKCYQSQEKASFDADSKLLGRLIGSKPLHGTTLRGVVMTFDVVAPLFVLRQWTRHIVGHDYWGADTWYCGVDTLDIGGAFDEQSFRYTDKIRFYKPADLTAAQSAIWDAMTDHQLDSYHQLRDAGMTKQDARCALGNHIYSHMEWTVNLQALLDWLGKRLPGGGAQPQTALYAVSVFELASKVAPTAIEKWWQSRASEIGEKRIDAK